MINNLKRIHLHGVTFNCPTNGRRGAVNVGSMQMVGAVTVVWCPMCHDRHDLGLRETIAEYPQKMERLLWELRNARPNSGPSRSQDGSEA